MAKLKIKIGQAEFMAEGEPEYIEKESSAFASMLRSFTEVKNITDFLPGTEIEEEKRRRTVPADEGEKVVRRKSEQVMWEKLSSSMQLYDEFECTLNNGDKAAFVLINESEDYLTFCSRDCMAKHQINTHNSNKGGIADSEMQKFLDTEIWSLLPDGLKNLISVTRRKYRDGEQVKEFETKLYLLSAPEVFDNIHCYGENGLYDQIEYFKDEKNRVKCMKKETVFWWLSTPHAVIDAHFCGVTTSGGAGYYHAGCAFGVVPCFRIRKS